MQLSGAEIFLESLKREGVDTLFALPGGVVLKIFDVLHQQKDIRVILTRHEQGAGHMAEGYAKATGKAGVALITSGPGMTNVITPLADAYTLRRTATPAFASDPTAPARRVARRGCAWAGSHAATRPVPRSTQTRRRRAPWRSKRRRCDRTDPGTRCRSTVSACWRG